jgi:hypothetical protein
MISFLLSYIVTNFSRASFTATPDSSSSPFIIFPYFDSKSPLREIFQAFEANLSEDVPVATAQVNCLDEITFCSLNRLKPTQIYYSYPPHFGFAMASERPITNEGLTHLANDLSFGNIRRDITSLSEIEKVATETPFFALVARSNAGDLELKFPVFERLAKNLTGKNIAFVFITDPSLYERFSEHPLTLLVFIRPTLRSVSFRGDFNFYELLRFVNEHWFPVFGEIMPSNGRVFAYLGKRIKDRLRDKTVPLQDSADLVFLNNSKYPWASAWICGNQMKCGVLIDRDSRRFVKVDLKLMGDEFVNPLKTFDEAWNNLTVIEKLTAKVEVLMMTEQYASYYLAFIGMILYVILVHLMPLAIPGLAKHKKV